MGDSNKIPAPGEIYYVKDKPYQIITIAVHTHTSEKMVVYQELFGEFRFLVQPLKLYMEERYQSDLTVVKDDIHEADPQKQVSTLNSGIPASTDTNVSSQDIHQDNMDPVSNLLLQFLDASSYRKKLEILTSNRKHINDRIINDMAISLDCTVDEGPLEERIQELIVCLEAMSRFEDRRLR